MGSGGGSSGGGGTAGGKIDYPKYIKRTHRHMLMGSGYKFGDSGGDEWKDINIPTGILRDIYAVHTQYAGFTNTFGTTNADDSANPYFSALPYDPNIELTASQEMFEEFYDLVRELSNVTNWQEFIDKADAKLNTTTNLNWGTILDTVRDEADATVLSDDAIGGAVDAFDTRSRQRMNKEIAELRAASADIGSVMSSSFTLGEALIRASSMQRTAEFSSDLERESYRERLAFIGKGVDQAIGVEISREQILNTASMDMSRIMAITLGTRQNAAQLQADINRMKIVARKEETDRELDIDVKSQLWDMKLWEMAGNVLASIAGASTIRKAEGDESSSYSALGGALSGAAAFGSIAGLFSDGPSMGGVQSEGGKSSGGLGGAASGAASGAAIGSVVPGIGTGIGAGIGAIAGFFR